MHSVCFNIDLKEEPIYSSLQMRLDALIGFAVVACALVVIIALALWSRRRINRIAKMRPGTARDIQQSLKRER